MRRRLSAILLLAISIPVAILASRPVQRSVENPSMHWYAKPEWFQLIVSIVGIAVITWQSILTRNSVQAAKAAADAFVSSERAWVVAELIPICARFGNSWHRPVGDFWAVLNEDEILRGDHLKHKLKLTNMGRTPAHILRYSLGFSRDADVSAGELRLVDPVKRPVIEFDRLLGGNESVDVTTIDVDGYVRQSIEEIGRCEAMGILNGWVEYQHVFSAYEVVNVPFVYLYLPTAQLRRIPLRKPVPNER